jgi:hypothetical protein
MGMTLGRMTLEVMVKKFLQRGKPRVDSTEDTIQALAGDGFEAIGRGECSTLCKRIRQNN